MKCRLFQGNLWGKMIKIIRIKDSLFFSLDEFASILGYIPSRKIIPELPIKNLLIESRLQFEIDDVRWDYSCIFVTKEDFIKIISMVPDGLSPTSVNTKQYLLDKLQEKFPFYTDTDLFILAEVGNDLKKFLPTDKEVEEKYLSPKIMCKLLSIPVVDIGIALHNLGLHGSQDIDHAWSVPVMVGKLQCYRYNYYVVYRVAKYFNITLPLTTPDSLRQGA